MADIPLSTIVGGGGRKVPSAIMGRSAGGLANDTQLIGGFAQSNAGIGAEIASGSTTADVYKTILTVSAPGVLKLALVASVDTTSRTIGLRIKLNAVKVFDVTTGAITLAGRGIVGVGGSTFGQSPTLDRIPFDTMSIEIKSSLTETNKLTSIVVWDLD